MGHTSGEDRASSNNDKAKPYRGAKALDSLSGACERQGVTALDDASGPRKWSAAR